MNHLLMDLQLLTPKLYLPTLADIDFAALASQGIFYYCLDLDNTLAPRTGQHPLPQQAEALYKAREAGYIRAICLVSNIICGEARRQRVARFAAELDTPYYVAASFWERKPSPKPFRLAMQMMNSQPSNTACVGDQLFTDIVGGNKLGLYSILVKPMGDDHWTTRLTRRRCREKKVLQRLGLEHLSAD
ncbi:YqeG family HAD IIIA-type phosphatase [bacterium]|nr:YqeG family HAD IIIA-type phosphatase [bacterium]